MGLSIAHKFTLIAIRQGQVFKISSVGHEFENTNPVPRGEVKGFSRGSRKRMIELLLRVNYELAGLPVFVTLTYPQKYPDKVDAKKHLFAFWERTKRKYGHGVWAIWKIERQKRGAPHYHLLIFGVGFMDKEWLSRAWFGVVKSGDVKHLNAGTRVESIRTKNGAVYYVSKYMGKDDDETNLGRVWGVLGRQNVKYHEVEVVKITEGERATLEAFYRNRVGDLYYAGQGFTLYGSVWGGVGELVED